MFHGSFLHADPLRMAFEALRRATGLARNQAWDWDETASDCWKPCVEQPPVCINLHTTRLFDPDVDLPAGPYRLHNIQPQPAAGTGRRPADYRRLGVAHGR